MNDNATAHKAEEYDSKIEQTTPYYTLIHEQALNLVQTYNKNPDNWIDTGCGTGILAMKIRSLFPDTKLVLADPSHAMLDIARKKMCGLPHIKYIESSTQDLKEISNHYDVITAILCHHYLSESAREKATEKVYEMLNKGGIYITFETIRPRTRLGTEIGLERWKDFQIGQGKSEGEAISHAARFGKEYYPITIEEHLKLLKHMGFSSIEILWVSLMQAGFFAVK